jgi:hypothetical protein
MKTPQEIFDIVSTHLLTQKRQARQGCDAEGNGSGICVYRSPEGLKCAVGCLIDDQHYKPIMEKAGSLINFDSMQLHELEGYTESARTQGAREVVAALMANDIDIAAQTVQELLNRLQGLHDNEPPERWNAGLQRVAADYHLKFHHAEY